MSPRQPRSLDGSPIVAASGSTEREPERLAGGAGPDPIGLLVVSNRLPELREPVAPDRERACGVGGLVAALEPVLAARGGLWLGWSGRTNPGNAFGPVHRDTRGTSAFAWIDLPEAMHARYYNGFCNRSLWPLFHTLPERARFEDAEWEAYREVNEHLAAAATELVPDGCTVWAHDFHLLLLASALRERGHRGPMGLFLHVPFPDRELFRLIPWADELLAGMLAYDVVGLQTSSDLENFEGVVAALSAGRDHTARDRRHRVRAGVFPIGIPPEPAEQTAEAGESEEVAALLRSIAGTRLLLGVDRLDYTKGIPARIEAFGRLLAKQPLWRGRLSLVQISVPSRTDVPEYQEERRRIETSVGHINGEFGEASWTPVRYLYRSYGRDELSRFYRAADVCLATPLRDGMNLVAKEFVAAQEPQRPGVLVLSRFAGAASELTSALLTNPFHPDGMATDLDRALRMSLQERRARHVRLLAAVQATSAHSWAEDILGALELAGSDVHGAPTRRHRGP